MRLLLFAPLAAIPTPPLMIIGSSNGRFMNFGAARGIGMTKLTPSSSQSGSPHCSRTHVSIGFIHDPSDPSLVITLAPLSLSLYVNDFVSFSKDPAVETLFCRLPAKRCKVDFMGIVEWFLGFHFSWRITHSSVIVHLNQSGFATNLSRPLPAKPAMRL